MHIDIFNGVHCVIHAAAETGFSHFPPAKLLEEVNVNGGKKIRSFYYLHVIINSFVK